MYTGWVFATYRRTVVATVTTAFMFTVFVRGELFPAPPKPGWLFRAKPEWLFAGNPLHGWSLVAVNFAFWAYLCWFGFWIIYRSEGRERLFLVGWFADILLWPVRWLEPRWAEPVRLIGTAGLALALLVALSVLLHPPKIPASADSLDVDQSR
jgi:hypothetical protein